MIDWLNEACKAWGRCTRWILADTGEGYPGKDTIERARQGMLSIGKGAAGQHWKEVRLGDALEVATAIRGDPHMPIELTATMWAQYVALGRVKHKLPGLSRYLGVAVSVGDYWKNVDRAHYFLAGRIRAK